MIPIRKQKLVLVSSADYTNTSTESLRFMSHRSSSNTTKLQSSIKAPINSYNLLLSEIYPDSYKRETDDSQPCTKLNFILLCCEPNATAEDIRYNFEQEYQLVECVDFTGHIGSMRLAFDLLKYFPKCKEVIFLINDYNVKIPYASPDTFEDLSAYCNVESVKIIHDFTIVEKSTLDVQSSAWRLDEILSGCEACFPSLTRLEVSIHGTGSNYDKISKFIPKNPRLSHRYSVEINNDKVRTKAKHRHASGQRALPPAGVASAAGRPAHDRYLTQGQIISSNTSLQASIPVDLSIVKKEASQDANEDQRSSNLMFPQITNGAPYRAPANVHESFQSQVHSTSNRNNSTPGLNGVDKLGSAAVFATRNFSTNVFPTSSGALSSQKALAWKDTTASSNSQDFPVSQQYDPAHSLTSSLTQPLPDGGYVASMINAEEMYRIPTAVTYEENDPRLRAARNPSPPPPASPTLSNSMKVSSTSQFNGDRPRAPAPPVISKHLKKHSDSSKRLVAYSQDGEIDSESSEDDKHLRKKGPKDPRARDCSVSRSRSVTPRRSSRSHSRSSSPYRRRRSRNSSDFSPGDDRYKKREKARREYSERKRYKRWSRSRSRSPSPPYSSSHGRAESLRKDNYRGKGRSGYYRGYKGSYNPAMRRGRGRGARGFRSRGRGRGQPSNRGFKPSSFNNNLGYYEDPRERVEDNWEANEQEGSSQDTKPL